MNVQMLRDAYTRYISCLNAQDWQSLHHFVAETAQHNGRHLGVAGYLEMLIRDYQQIPDLHFNIGLLVVEPPTLASRLDFDCTPAGSFLSLPVNGKKIQFSENVFYEFVDYKIDKVWSIIDKSAIEAQLSL
ncbi:ester cyclase [Brucella pituitosa]|uniref:Ester cyclase n=2 Tax=Brucella/Ochrobactrum group TaxID=2826938 RepID=A0A643F3U6_9HYPH|nr:MULTISPECIES: ester cyclase [Brucella]PQZ51718.1 ester cyclase [Ochrobactrum sp. MYb19]PRA56381.1 ester cyclase [Ochrobactrum sp. MYb68]PRA65248.1 ester cyclase [Ochrobactrum sp. MYb18]PRA76938.1 ester cyclase [Brucella thiophenivorans]PRA86048.1 ester cyclase [Ochrobactrum sp. MYb29]PRA93428.1 ester cyclase [Ochrobactrum sp. MYb14]PRA98946.1 ester cyclase [Ochrobactrum sp. MYb15]